MVVYGQGNTKIDHITDHTASGDDDDESGVSDGDEGWGRVPNSSHRNSNNVKAS